MVVAFCIPFVAMIIHELGHYVVALCFGFRIKFQFQWGVAFCRIPIPRYVWGMPQTTENKQQIIALAGFATELAAIPIVHMINTPWGLSYFAFVLIHLLLYSNYAGDYSDFKWVKWRCKK